MKDPAREKDEDNPNNGGTDRAFSPLKKSEVTNTAIAIATIVIAASTIIYTIFAIKQWRAMNESNQINRQSLESVQRAFITFHTITQERTVRRYPSGDKHYWYFMGSIDNSGNTPAIDMIRYFGSGSEAPSEEQFVGDRNIEFRAFTLGPKAAAIIGPKEESEASVFGSDLGVDLRKTFTSEPKNLFFWGWIAYRDVFPKTELHITEFCQRLSGAELTSDGKAFQLLYTTCPSANHDCTDQNCRDYEQIAGFSAEILARHPN